MTALDAAVAVLQDEGGPLHYGEITQRALEKGYWSTAGKTPSATVNAQIAVEVKTKEASRFVRVGKGIYGLSEHVGTPAPATPVPAASAASMSFTDAAASVLDRHADRQPMHYRAITERVLADGLVQTQGKTPEATLAASVTSEIDRFAKRGEVSRFVRHGKGYIGLRKWMGQGLAFQFERHNANVRKKLLARLRTVDPDDFEALIAQLLVALGFEDVEVTNRSNDGGIDVRGTLVVGGVVRTEMAVQAKRWRKSSNVRRPTVQQVRGSLGAHEQGLIITTSGFSKGAVQDARDGTKKPIGLMDGEQLTKLLVEHQIGVVQTEMILLEPADLDLASEDGTG